MDSKLAVDSSWALRVRQAKAGEARKELAEFVAKNPRICDRLDYFVQLLQHSEGVTPYTACVGSFLHVEGVQMYFVKITVDLPENGPVRWTLVYPAQSRGTLQWYPSVKAAIAAHLLLAEQPPED